MGKAPKQLDELKTKKMQQVLSNLDGKFKIQFAPEFAKLVNYSSKSDEPIHRWFRYREGYSTKLVEAQLNELPSGKLIVDPFCGSGTTLLTAKNFGYQSIGIDVNPLSVFVTKTKTRNYSRSHISSFEEVCKKIKKLSIYDKAASKPALNIIDKVFLPEVLHALLVIKHYIDTYLNLVERDFFLLAWLSILEELSNVYKEGNGIKYRNRKRTPNGYETIPLDIWQQSIFPEDKFEHVIKTFLERTSEMIHDIKQSPNKGQCDAFVGDALMLDDFVEPNSAGLVIFSPPYINNFNYFKAYKVELWMGGFVSNYSEIQEITRSSLRSHVETQLMRDTDSKNWYPDELDTLIDLVDQDTLWTPRIINAIKGYFFDMNKVIEKIKDSLEPNGKCTIVVGNSAYGSILFPTDTLLAEIATESGLEVEEISVARHLTTSSQQKQALEASKGYLRESIIMLKKPRATARKQSNGNGEFKYRLVSELPKFPKTSQSLIYAIKNKGLTDSVHIIHKYPGKFIPHIPRWAINKYLEDQKNKTILDPFCGSGTTLVEGAFAGHKSLGVDIDPLARLISKVKTTPIETNKLIKSVDDLIKKIERYKGETFTPIVPTLNHWFTPSAIRDLGCIRTCIEAWYKSNKDVDIYDFFIISFSGIIRKASKADNQSLKTYVSGTLKKKQISAIPLFLETIKEYAERIIQFTAATKNGGSSTVLDAKDSRVLSEFWKKNKLPQVDLVVTSPPYIKTVDYVYNQMAEYFWIGDLFNFETQEKQNTAKQLYIGSEKVAQSQYKEKFHIGNARIDEITNNLFEKEPKHAYIFYKYFSDMKSHFQQMKSILKSGGVYVLIVGNSSISGLEIPTIDLLREIASLEGFEAIQQFGYEIRNRYMRFPRQGRGGIVHIDWVLSLRKK